MRVDEVEGFLEFLARHLVEFGDGELRVLDRLHQVVALAAQEAFALLAFLKFLERHHVHRAHRFDARLHFVVVRFGGDQFFADQQLRCLRHQFFGLRVQFGDAGLAQVVAVGIVARLFDLALAALGAKLVERLALAAQRFVELAGARPRFVPFLFERRFLLFEADFLRAQLFGLLRKLLAGGLRARTFPAAARRAAAAKRIDALVRLRDFSARRCSTDFGAREAFGHGGQLFAARDHAFLQSLKIVAQVRRAFPAASAASASAAARERSASACSRRACSARARADSASACRRAISSRSAASCCSTRREFAARLVALVRGGDERFFRFHVLRDGGGNLLLRPRDFVFEARQAPPAARARCGRAAPLPFRAGEVRA